MADIIDQFRAIYGWSIPKNINDSLRNLDLLNASETLKAVSVSISSYMTATQKAMMRRVNQQDPIRLSLLSMLAIRHCERRGERGYNKILLARAKRHRVELFPPPLHPNRPLTPFGILV